MKQAEYEIPDPLITTSADWLGGQTCFTGRRVPVKALFDYLKAGHTVDEFLADYPSISHEHAVAVIETANKALDTPVAAE